MTLSQMPVVVFSYSAFRKSGVSIRHIVLSIWRHGTSSFHQPSTTPAILWCSIVEHERTFNMSCRRFVQLSTSRVLSALLLHH